MEEQYLQINLAKDIACGFTPVFLSQISLIKIDESLRYRQPAVESVRFSVTPEHVVPWNDSYENRTKASKVQGRCLHHKTDYSIVGDFFYVSEFFHR